MDTLTAVEVCKRILYPPTPTPDRPPSWTAHELSQHVRALMDQVLVRCDEGDFPISDSVRTRIPRSILLLMASCGKHVEFLRLLFQGEDRYSMQEELVLCRFLVEMTKLDRDCVKYLARLNRKVQHALSRSHARACRSCVRMLTKKQLPPSVRFVSSLLYDITKDMQCVFSFLFLRLICPLIISQGGNGREQVRCSKLLFFITSTSVCCCTAGSCLECQNLQKLGVQWSFVLKQRRQLTRFFLSLCRETLVPHSAGVKFMDTPDTAQLQQCINDVATVLSICQNTGSLQRVVSDSSVLTSPRPGSCRLTPVRPLHLSPRTLQRTDSAPHTRDRRTPRSPSEPSTPRDRRRFPSLRSLLPFLS